MAKRIAIPAGALEKKSSDAATVQNLHLSAPFTLLLHLLFITFIFTSILQTNATNYVLIDPKEIGDSITMGIFNRCAQKLIKEASSRSASTSLTLNIKSDKLLRRDI